MPPVRAYSEVLSWRRRPSGAIAPPTHGAIPVARCVVVHEFIHSGESNMSDENTGGGGGGFLGIVGFIGLLLLLNFLSYLFDWGWYFY
jgi:hypothetical protein